REEARRGGPTRNVVSNEALRVPLGIEAVGGRKSCPSALQRGNEAAPYRMVLVQTPVQTEDAIQRRVVQDRFLERWAGKLSQSPGEGHLYLEECGRIRHTTGLPSALAAVLPDAILPSGRHNLPEQHPPPPPRSVTPIYSNPFH